MTPIAFIGSGPVALNLAKLAREVGYPVMLSSRTPGKIVDGFEARTFEEAARWGEIVVLAIPYRGLAEALPGLAPGLVGKVVVDATNPLNEDYSPMVLGVENSAGEVVARLLPGVRVVKAFNSIFADVMRADRQERAGLRATMFVAGDDLDARKVVADFSRAIGFAPVETGPMRTARYLEAMAHLNIQIAFSEGGGTNGAFLYHQAA